MRFWTFVKLCAALVVLAIMALTGMLAWHVAVEPLDGPFSEWIPNPVRVADAQAANEELVRVLAPERVPDADPGTRAFAKARELIALGRIGEARERLTTIVNVYPASSAAPDARRILGEMNLDEILSTSHIDDKQLHIVQRGDALLGIAARYRTHIDAIMHLNSMLELRGLHPGDELLVLPLDFRLLVEPRRMTLSLWDGGRFIRDYPLLHVPANLPAGPRVTTITSLAAETDGRRVPPQSTEFRGAAKSLQLENPSIRIRGWDGDGDKPPAGILLRPHDMEELALLTRPGNDVEFR